MDVIGDGLGQATAKHFMVYNVEGNIPDGGNNANGRISYNAKVSHADLWQTFLPHWEEIIREGQPGAVMCSYNAVNGIPMCASPLLHSLLRERLKFKGMIMSDGGAVTMIGPCKHHHSLLISGSCHDYTNTTMAAAIDALSAGVDMNSGGYMKDENPQSGYGYEWLEQALQEKKISPDQLRNATRRVMQLRMEVGLLSTDQSRVPSVWTALTTEAIDSSQHRILARQSAIESAVLLKNKDSILPLDATKLKRVAILGPNSDRAESLLGSYAPCYTRNRRLIGCNLVTPLSAISTALKKHGVAVEHVEGSEIVRSAWSWNGVKEAVGAAGRSDVAIVVVGLIGDNAYTSFKGQVQEGESHDRSSLRLPAPQLKLLQAVIKRQPKTIVVFISGGPVSEPWVAEHAPAIVYQSYPGEEGGTALAELLLGKVGFTGRLPLTIVESEKELPSFVSQDMSAKPGRTYRYYSNTPLFSFGFGMSTLGHFSYSDLNVRVLHAAVRQGSSISHARQQLAADIVLTVEVSVTNHAVKPSDEIVQVFAAITRNSTAAWDRPSVPNQSLIAFCRKRSIPAKAKQKVAFAVRRNSLWLVDADGTRKILPAEYTICAGGRKPGVTGRYVDSSQLGVPAEPLCQKIAI